MKKILLSLLLTLTLGVGAAWAASYKKVQTTQELEVGAQYIIVYDTYAMGAQNGNYRNRVSIPAAKDNIIQITTQTIAEVTLESSGNSTFPYKISVMNGNATSYLYNGGGTSNYLKTTTEKVESAYCKIQVNASATPITFNKQKNNTNFKLQYNANSGQERFSCYTGTQNDITLYKKVNAGPVEVTPVFSPLTANVGEDGTISVNPDDFYTGVNDLVFTVPDENVVVIDFDGSFITGAAGTVEVTATWNDGTKYKGGEAKFNFTVVDPDAMVFKFEKDAYEFAMGGAVDAVLVNNKDLAYNLSSSDPTVAFISPVDGESIWMLKPGTATITATVADGEYAGTKAEYLLTVNPEPIVGASGTATYDFTTNGYGMELVSGDKAPYNETVTPDGSITLDAVDGFVIKTNKNSTSTGTRFWNASSGTEFRVYSGVSLTVVAPAGYNITNVIYYDSGEAATSNPFTVSSDKATAEFKASKTTKITKIVVEYESATGGRTDHEACGLGFYENAYEAIVNDITLLGKVSYLPGNVDVNVQYMVCDAEGKGTVDVQFDFTEDGDMFVYSEALGNYKLMAYVAPTDKYYPAVVWADLNVVELGTPAELWMHGHFIDRYYDLYQPVAMTKDGDVFTAKGIVIGGNANVTDGDLGCVFTTHVPDGAEAHAPAKRYAAEHTADWAAHTKGYVLDNTGLKKAHEVNAQSDIEPIIAPEGAASYDVKVDFTDATAPKVTLTKVGEITGIENIVADADAEVEYFNLQGIRVDNPEHGVFIRRQGARVSRIAL